MKLAPNTALTLLPSQVGPENQEDRKLVFDEAVKYLTDFGFETTRAHHVLRMNAEHLLVMSTRTDSPLTEEQALHLEAAATVIRFRRG
jgi:hypothetical protein